MASVATPKRILKPYTGVAPFHKHHHTSVKKSKISKMGTKESLLDMPLFSLPGSDKELPSLDQSAEASTDDQKRTTITMRESLLQTQMNSYMPKPRYASPVSCLIDP
jgi:HSP90 family molecular chaperone